MDTAIQFAYVVSAALFIYGLKHFNCFIPILRTKKIDAYYSLQDQGINVSSTQNLEI